MLTDTLLATQHQGGALLPKVIKPRAERPSRWTVLLGHLKEHSWLINLSLTLLVFVITQYQLHLHSQAIVVAECRLSDKKHIEISLEKDRAVVGFATRCAVRNVGSKTVDLVEARTGLTIAGHLIHMPTPAAQESELTRSVVVNGESFIKPVALQPGGQATVDLILNFSAYVPQDSESRIHWMACIQEHPAEGKGVLDACMAKLGIKWTDFLRGAKREYLSEFDAWTIADGLGGVFMLSSGGYAFGEVEFKYGWGWSCRPSLTLKLRPPPKYIDCSNVPIQ
jgi:hypothetical protein